MQWGYGLNLADAEECKTKISDANYRVTLWKANL